jgi:hypothetical protein
MLFSLVVPCSEHADGCLLHHHIMVVVRSSDRSITAIVLHCVAGAVTKVNSYEVVRELERGTTADVKLCRRSISAPSDEPEQLYVSHVQRMI